MKGKILLVAGFAAGYVLGAKAGREQYNKIAATAGRFWNDPRVQDNVEKVETFVKDKAPDVAEFVSDNAKTAVSKVTGKKRPSGSSTPSSSASSRGTAASTSGTGSTGSASS